MCPFCKEKDPYEYVNIGIGMQPVAVNCCMYGYMFLQEQIPYEEVKREWLKSLPHRKWEYYEREEEKLEDIPF